MRSEIYNSPRNATGIAFETECSFIEGYVCPHVANVNGFLDMQYTSRGMERRCDTDRWEVTLSHKDPITGEQVRPFRTIVAKTEK